MVRPLDHPDRPISGGATTGWEWLPPTTSRPWGWCRVYHRSSHTPDGHSPRRFGPLYRFDQHQLNPSDPHQPWPDPDGRSVLYVGTDLATSACEVFGEASEARLCPNYRVAIVRPVAPLVCFDLLEPGAAMAIGALPSLADGHYARSLTQEWARAMYEDQPTGTRLDGVRYRSGYNSGESYGLWDSAGKVETLTHGGVLQDFTLTEPTVLRRLMVELPARHIPITTVTGADCPSCQ